MTDASVPPHGVSQTAEDWGEQPTAYEDLLRYAQDEVEAARPLLDALLGSSARSSHAV